MCPGAHVRYTACIYSRGVGGSVPKDKVDPATKELASMEDADIYLGMVFRETCPVCKFYLADKRVNYLVAKGTLKLIHVNQLASQLMTVKVDGPGVRLSLTTPHFIIYRYREDGSGIEVLWDYEPTPQDKPAVVATMAAGYYKTMVKLNSEMKHKRREWAKREARRKAMRESGLNPEDLGEGEEEDGLEGPG